MCACREEFEDPEIKETDEKQKEKAEEPKDFWAVESDEEVVKHLNLYFPR